MDQNLGAAEKTRLSIEWIDDFQRQNTSKFSSVEHFKDMAVEACPEDFKSMLKKPYAFFTNALDAYCRDLKRIEYYLNKKTYENPM